MLSVCYRRGVLSIAMMMTLACDDSTPAAPSPAPAPVTAPGGADGPPGMPALAGSTGAEDLTDSWSDALAVPVERYEGDSCADNDGDGFLNALSCPGASPSRLDCDDADPDVTPETERWIRSGPFIMGSASDHAGVDEEPALIIFIYIFYRDHRYNIYIM